MRRRRNASATAAAFTMAMFAAFPALAGQGAAIGTLLGAGLGGYAGSQIGRGEGNVAATVTGIALGGAVGGSIGQSYDNSRRSSYRSSAAPGFFSDPLPPYLPYSPYVPNYVAPSDAPERVDVPMPVAVSVNGDYCQVYFQPVLVGNQVRQERIIMCQSQDGSWRTEP